MPYTISYSEHWCLTSTTSTFALAGPQARVNNPIKLSLYI